MIDDFLLKKCVKGISIKLDIEESLVNNYLDSRGYEEKRSTIIRIISSLHQKFFNKFNNSYKLFESLKDFENKLLYKLLFYYRDHFLHSFQVFLLGIYFIDVGHIGGHVFDFLSNKDKEGFIRIWFLISVFHDIGYLAQKLIKISENIEKLYFENISGVEIIKLSLSFSKRLTKLYKKFLEEIATGLIIGEELNYFSDREINIQDIQKDFILNELVEALNNRNHGIISALFLYNTLILDIDFIEHEKRKKYLNEFKLACGAISTHDIEKAKKFHLRINDNPFASLIILCDSIQEWCRPKELNFNKLKEELFDKFEISYDMSEKVYIIFFKLISNEDTEFKTIKKKIFGELTRLFSNTFISGPDFSFTIKNESKSASLKLNYKKASNEYEIIEE